MHINRWRSPLRLDLPDSRVHLCDVGDVTVCGQESIWALGGRMASLIADERGAAALVCLGYPFHPPGKPDWLRTEHLRVLHTPTLICQGTRDTFGKPEQMRGRMLTNMRQHPLRYQTK